MTNHFPCQTREDPQMCPIHYEETTQPSFYISPSPCVPSFLWPIFFEHLERMCSSWPLPSGHPGPTDFSQERPVDLILAYANMSSFLLGRRKIGETSLSLALGFLKLINSQMNFTFANTSAGLVLPLCRQWPYRLPFPPRMAACIIPAGSHTPFVSSSAGWGNSPTATSCCLYGRGWAWNVQMLLKSSASGLGTCQDETGQGLARAALAPNSTPELRQIGAPRPTRCLGSRAGRRFLACSRSWKSLMCGTP